MVKKSEYSSREQLNNPVELATNLATANEKKPFVEPEISPAVDVLEATTFLQASTSGATN